MKRVATRTPIIQEAQQLKDSVKELEQKRNALRSELEIARQTVEDQKKEASLISAIMQRNELPDLGETSARVEELQSQIEETKRHQKEMEQKTKQIKKNINKGIEQLEQSSKRDQLLASIRALEEELRQEQKREEEYKLKHSQLSADLLKRKVAKKALLQELDENVVEAPDINALQNKLNSLHDHVEFIEAKKEAFEQEYEATQQDLIDMQQKKKDFLKLQEQNKASNPENTKKSILETAAANLDLRRYKELTDEAKNIDHYADLIDECEALIKLAETATNSV